MSKRKRHANKDIEEAVQLAESRGWRYQKVGASAHAWGRLLCPERKREGCAMSVWSTPRNAGIHVQQIRRRLRQCPHRWEER